MPPSGLVEYFVGYGCKHWRWLKSKPSRCAAARLESGECQGNGSSKYGAVLDEARQQAAHSDYYDSPRRLTAASTFSLIFRRAANCRSERLRLRMVFC